MKPDNEMTRQQRRHMERRMAKIKASRDKAEARKAARLSRVVQRQAVLQAAGSLEAAR